MNHDTSKPAFPFQFASDAQCDNQYGLTERKLFAGMAMQGILSSGMKFNNTDMKRIAENSVLMADELLKQLNEY